jgi:hypothetical protein
MRRRARIAFVILVAIGAGASAAAPKKGRPSQSLPVGTEVVVIIRGDEGKSARMMVAAKAIGPDSFIMTAEGDQEYSRDEAWEAYSDLMKAIRSADPEGVQRLVAAGRAFAVKAGTRARVVGVTILGPPNGPIPSDILPFDRNGRRKVRVIDGPLSGRVFELPARNLRPADEPEAEEPVAKQAPDPVKRAASLLTIAKSLEKLKKTKAALDTYRQVVREYPQTPSAKEAGERIKALEGK